MNIYTYTAPTLQVIFLHLWKKVAKISYASAGASISDNLHEAPAIGTAI